MPLLRAGLVVAALVCLSTAAASAARGFAVEVAITRGLLAFVGVVAVAYVAEIIVSTAPPAPPVPQDGPADQDEAEAEAAGATRAGRPLVLADGTGSETPAEAVNGRRAA